MKKKLVVVILVIICIAGIVFAGFYRRKHKDVMQEETSSQENSESVEAEEQKRQQQIQKDVASAEQKHIFTMEDGKQSFGGFGFEVKKLKLYDSPADFEASEDYRKDYSDPDIKLEDESMIVYAEIEVTNESDSKQAYYPNELIAAPVNADGYSYDPDLGFEDGNPDPIKGSFSEVFYANPAEHPVDAKNPTAPKLQLGESALVKVGIQCVSYGEDGSVKPSELFDPCTWYLGIPGADITMGAAFNVNKDTKHIFISIDS